MSLRFLRGPSGKGVVRDQKIPLQWSSECNLAWKVAVLDEEGNSVLLEASGEFPMVGQGKS